MIGVHCEKVIIVQRKFPIEIDKQREIALKKLKEINKNYFNDDEKNYLKIVIDLFELNPISNVVKTDVVSIKNLIDRIGVIPPNSRFYKNGKTKKQLKTFIIEALGYKRLRKSFYPKYFKELEIKACVYCNSQLSITARKPSKNDLSAKFDVDHYHSKDDYPFLSICLFNLYPACAPCNRSKSKNDNVEFELYTNNIERTSKSQYGFQLTKHSKAKYLITHNPDDIEIVFNEPDYSIGKKDFKEVFHIEGIYETQKDIVEELFIKNQIYNPSYIKQLKNNFNLLSLNPELFKRLLVGGYTEDKDIHKRPMNKFIMDIAKDIELI